MPLISGYSCLPLISPKGRLEGSAGNVVVLVLKLTTMSGQYDRDDGTDYADEFDDKK